MSTLKKAILLAGTPICLGLGYLKYLAHSNHRDYLQSSLRQHDIKDSTRPDYEFFGLNWGANSDQELLDDCDTGDFVFSSVSCDKLFSVGDIAKCYKKQLEHTGHHRESNLAGILVRDSEQVYVVFTHLGRVSYLTYSEFIRQGYHR